MRSRKDPHDIEKIEAVLFKVNVALPFVPFKAHDLYIHILCPQARRLPLILDSRGRLSQCAWEQARNEVKRGAVTPCTYGIGRSAHPPTSPTP